MLHDSTANNYNIYYDDKCFGDCGHFYVGADTLGSPMSHVSFGSTFGDLDDIMPLEDIGWIGGIDDEKECEDLSTMVMVPEATLPETIARGCKLVHKSERPYVLDNSGTLVTAWVKIPREVVGPFVVVECPRKTSETFYPNVSLEGKYVISCD